MAYLHGCFIINILLALVSTPHSLRQFAWSPGPLEEAMRHYSLSSSQHDASWYLPALYTICMGMSHGTATLAPVGLHWYLPY